MHKQNEETTQTQPYKQKTEQGIFYYSDNNSLHVNKYAARKNIYACSDAECNSCFENQENINIKYG